MKSPQRHGAYRRPAGHADSARSPQAAQRHERSPPTASPERTGAGNLDSTPAPPVSKPAPRKSLGPVAWHAEMRRLLDELDSDGGKSQAAMLQPVVAGGSCEPVLSNDDGKSVLEDLQGMLTELQEGQARLQAVHGKTKVMQAQVTEYVEQRLREHTELWEDRIAQEVGKQLADWAAALQQQEGSCALNASAFTPPASQGQNTEAIQCMNICSSMPSTLASPEAPNLAASEDQEDHSEQDLLQQEFQDGICQQLVAIEQRLEAAVATAELAAPSLLDMSRCEASVTALLSTRTSGSASQARTLKTCSRLFPQRRTSPEPSSPVPSWSEGGEQHQKCGATSPRLGADKTSPRWQLQRKTSGSQSLADILEHRRRTCEGLPPPSSEVVLDSPGDED